MKAPLIPMTQGDYYSILGMATLAREQWSIQDKLYNTVKHKFPGLEDYWMDAYMDTGNLDNILKEKIGYAGYKINDKKDVNGVI